MNNAATIRPLSMNDLSMVLAWRNHLSIRSMMFNNRLINPDEHCAWFDIASQDPERRLLIVESDAEPVGFVQYNCVKAGGVSDWGFYVRPGAPSGTGRILGVTALDHAFGPLQLHKVCGRTIASNEASIRLHNRLGFQQEGLFREQHPADGTYHSVVCFGLLRHEWQVVRTKLMFEQLRQT